MRVIGSIEDPSVIRAIPRSGRGQASNTWDYGWQEQGRRRKSMHRQGDMTESCPHSPLSISKHTLMTSTATSIIPGINTSSHNAS